MDEQGKLFTEEQLAKFDELTRLESSKKQMDRIRARLEWNRWVEENNLSKKHLDAMYNELVSRGKWQL
ncbi:hypothetical protein ABE137_12075 [Brevibacillus laterosporus]|uniref:hypothetical protein n=1 Tax=Brevibacillus phage Sundance TaxID=1691958 RepID=UPI0006BDEAAD|nr:hypothetical protein AVT09_gp084 [Brevibacillus phage Sundance]ALA47900.1 hypothetical protein SUNDANCE_84 [Brevibacillus phage Sundance]